MSDNGDVPGSIENDQVNHTFLDESYENHHLSSADSCSVSDRSRSHSVESILTSKSFARNVPGLVQSLSEQERSLIKCITQRILDEVMPLKTPSNFEHSIQLVVPGTVQGNKNRYMVILTGACLDRVGNVELEEHAIIGLNVVTDVEDTSNCPHHECPNSCRGEIIVAMVLPITRGMCIKMDGDGGIRITSTDPANRVEYVFKPVNLQALWVSHSYLNTDMENARRYNLFPGSRNHHTWAGCYLSKIPGYLTGADKWEDTSQIENQVGEYDFLQCPKEKKLMDSVLSRMREIIMTIDLDTANCLAIRNQLEEEFNMSLKEYKYYLNEQIVKVFGQFSEEPSKIFDYLYLGNEWNASNLPQLKELGVCYVLNVTMEIANFFPHEMSYMNVRLKDVEESDLKKYFDETYNFIKHAKRENKKVLVHCRMGVSRSASCVIAYIMKEYSMNLDCAYNYVKRIRGCVKPNAGFHTQLEEYNGILEARHNNVFGKKTVTRARCPQVSEQKLITERWLKERDVYSLSDDCSELENESDEETPPRGQVDGVEKVSEWMIKNENGIEEAIPRKNTNRVIAKDLLLEIKKDISGTATPTLEYNTAMLTPSPPLPTPNSPSGASFTDDGMDYRACKASSRSSVGGGVKRRTPDTTTPQPGGKPDNEAAVKTEDHDILVADGPYTDIEHVVKEATHNLSTSDPALQDELNTSVIGRIKSNPSFRRNTPHASSIVRERVVKIEVETERHKISEARNIKHKRNRRQKSSQGASASSDRKNKSYSRRHKICSSIKRIIEKLLSPSQKDFKYISRDKYGSIHSAKTGTETIAFRAYKDKNGKSNTNTNRMSMPVLDSQNVCSLPKRRCQSQIYASVNSDDDH